MSYGVTAPTVIYYAILRVSELADGKVEPATVADHIEPHHGNANAFWLGKLQSLCRHWHESRKKFVERRGYDKAIGLDGWPIDPRHPVYRSEPKGSA